MFRSVMLVVALSVPLTCFADGRQVVKFNEADLSGGPWFDVTVDVGVGPYRVSFEDFHDYTNIPANQFFLPLETQQFEFKDLGSSLHGYFGFEPQQTAAYLSNPVPFVTHVSMSGASAAGVPEPSSIALISLAALLMRRLVR